jgi:hypothetical protein
MPPIGPRLGNFQTPNLGIFRVPITREELTECCVLIGDDGKGTSPLNPSAKLGRGRWNSSLVSVFTSCVPHWMVQSMQVRQKIRLEPATGDWSRKLLRDGEIAVKQRPDAIR